MTHSIRNVLTYLNRYYDFARNNSRTKTIMGWDYSIGEAMKDHDMVKNQKNWMAEYKCIKRGIYIDRCLQIDYVLQKILKRFNAKELTKSDLYGNLGYDLTFKKGVVFQDMGPIMKNVTLFNLFIDLCITELESYDIISVDYVAGIDARGFYFGPLLANRLGAGFIPIRKKNKLPGETISIDYSTEYSVDTIEIQKDAFMQKNNIQTVLIVDDLVATGGSLIAACKLIEQFNGIKIIGCFCPFKVDDLVISAQTKITRIVNTKLITL